MTRKEIIAKIKRTRAKMNELTDDNFRFADWISETKDSCPTVACIAGYYPKWFDDSPFEYSDNGNILQIRKGYSIGISHMSHADQIIHGLMQYHRLSDSLTECLFMGDRGDAKNRRKLELKDGREIPFITLDAGIEEVKKHWDKIISLMDKGNLDNHIAYVEIGGESEPAYS